MLTDENDVAEVTESTSAEGEVIHVPETDISPPDLPRLPPKRTRKKKDSPAVVPKEPPVAEAPAPAQTEQTEPAAPVQPEMTQNDTAPILTVDVRGDVVTNEDRADIAWHEIHNAYRTRRILTGILGGVEQQDNGKSLAVVEYKGYRVAIPVKEMLVGIPNDLRGQQYTNLMLQLNKRLSNMMGCEIDFVVMGIDSKARTIVASRAEAMLRKRQLFYFEPDDQGKFRVYEGRVIQARVISVAEKAVRIEAFGVEYSIMAMDLSWDWVGDARDRYSVGDQVLVRIQKVNRTSPKELTIRADIRSVSDSGKNNLEFCRVQGKYAGKVTDVHKGVVYVRLTNGVNAVAHSCYDRRTPGKKDDVSFAVTAIDEERGIALGIITRIIRQNL